MSEATSNAMAKPIVAVETFQPHGLRRSRGLVTLLALALEFIEAILVLMMADLAIADLAQRAPYADHGYSLLHVAMAFGVVQYLLVPVELTAAHRFPRKGFTLPIIFLPLGRALRMVLLIAVCLLAIVPKLVVYFVYLTIGSPILALISRLGNSTFLRVIDVFDVWFEPIEHATSVFYNALHYGKIEERGGAFTAAFNFSLTLWCLNH